MKPLLFPCLLAAAIFLAPAQELPALKWTNRDQQSLMRGAWWNANPPLLPPVDAAAVPSSPMPEPAANADSPAVDPIPEDFTDVNEYFLPDYIRTSTGLIDPQKLLAEVESNDVIELIKLIKSRYNVNLFVSIFAAGQKVPPSVNAPTIARQIFRNKERNLLLHFHMGDIKSAQIALDPELSSQLGDAGRRDLLYQVKQDASRFTNPQDELIEAMISLARRTEADMASAPRPTLPALEPDNPASIPEANIYGEQNVISAYVHKDEKTPHMHFAFVPVTEDKKRGGEKVSAKEVITKNDLKTFHTDLERYLDSFRDWHFEVVNEATKDGNKEIAELKKQTAHEEVLKAQQEALQARQRALQEQESIKPLVEQKNALRGEIEALQTEKEVLTAAEVEAIKGEKTLLGGLKGVTHKEFEAVKRTAVAVESMTAERDQALARAERADLRATAAEAKVKTAYEDANRQLQAKIREVEQDRPSMKAQMEIVQLRKENQTLKTENNTLRSKVSDLEAMVRRLGQIIREKLPEVYAAITQPKRDRQQPPQKQKPKSRDLER